MKRCARCEREIPESAAECVRCAAPEALPWPATDNPALLSLPAPKDTHTAHPPALPGASAPVITAPPVAAAQAVSAPQPARVTSTAGTVPAQAKRSNRRAIVAAALVLAGGTLTFAMLRSLPPAAGPPAPVTAPNPRPKPAAAPATAAAAPAPALAAPSAVPAATSKWKTANAEWLLDAKRGVAFELPSENRVAIWQGVTQPMLVVRCAAGRVQTFVYTASALQMEAVDENHTVRLSFDSNPEIVERWADSAEHDALFAPDGAVFARRLTTAHTLRVSYTPHNAARVAAEFHTAGLSELLVPATKQCGVKK